MSLPSHRESGSQPHNRASRQVVGSDRAVEVTAPCRLHFGLLSFGQPSRRQWGGVGVMVDHPAVRLSARPAQSLQISGLMADRTEHFVRCWASYQGWTGTPGCQLQIQQMAAAHSGLGTGTQLGLSVATALNAMYDMPQPAPAELAASVDRGLRSAVGTYGFADGGLIVERGKLPGEAVSPLDMRLDLPENWRFVLIHPRAGEGLSGAAEQTAFQRLPPVPPAVTDALTQELRLRMIPAAAAGDFDAFSGSIYRYGRMAGDCFRTIQGGPYNGPRLAALVARIRDMGITGIGQSSWGPILFALLSSHSAADTFVDSFASEQAAGELELIVAGVSNHGATVQVND